MLYIFLNMIGIEVGGLLSGLAQKYVSKKQTESVMIIANLCIAAVGIQGAIATQNSALMIISCVLGALVGTAIDLDEKFNRLGVFLKSRFKNADGNFVKGFITVFMIQCVGSMAIVGPLDVGLRGDPSILIFKIVLDTCSTLIYGSVYGYSVMLSGPFVFLYEAAIFFFAGAIQPFLTEVVINEISAIGSLLIFGMSLDLLGVLRLKVANYLPAILGPIVWHIILMVV